MQSTITTNETEKKHLESLTKSFKKDVNLHSFATIFLENIPFKTLLKYDSEFLIPFIQDRYQHLQSSISKLGTFTINKSADPNKKDIFCLEMAFPDAPYLIVTLEALFKKHHLQITELHHPIFTLDCDKKGAIKSISKPAQDTFLVSQVYIEFTSKSGDIDLKSLKKDIDKHMDAVQAAKRDHDDMISTLMSIKEDISKVTEPLAKFQDEWVDLLDWLKGHNFSFFGYTALEVETKDKSCTIKTVKDSQKGILSKEFIKNNVELYSVLEAQCESLAQYRSPFIFDTIAYKSPVQRLENLMRLSLKIPVSKNKVIEHNFVGLLKQSSLLVKNLETPIIREKMRAIFNHKHLIPGSYDFNQIIRFFTATPKFELFRTPTENLLELVDDLLSITNPNEIYCFTRTQIKYSRPFLLVCIPYELFTHENIESIKTYLNESLSLNVSEIIKARNELFCRLHIHFDHASGKAAKIDAQKIEKDLRERVKPWDEQLRSLLQTTFSTDKAHSLYQEWVNQFPNHHKARRTPEQTIRDITFLEKMQNEGEAQFNLMPFTFKDSTLSDKASILFIYNPTKIDLISIMPIIQDFGIHIYDELTTRIGSKDKILGYIHSFRITNKNLEKIDEEEYRELVVSLLRAIFKGYAIKDPLNALLFGAKMKWEAIKVLQAYRAYYLQLNTRYSREKINSTLLKYCESTSLLFKYFEAKFSTKKGLKSAKHRAEKVLPEIHQEFLDSLAKVDDIDSDVILKRFFSFIDATLRTNFFIPKDETQTFVSFKLESPKIKLPLPVPYREIFVFDPEMEGCHLRFGAVARGGLRWSDRLDDFRREVLGLVKAQQTKNVVIVPVGSKGGFVIKKPINTKEEAAVESQIQYKKFIKGLLDITDNLDADANVLHPDNVIRYDAPDPYLVVAADKGTAQFSDLANEISEEYNCWLGDGFASGGSYGYNHKEVGITAKGGWECVKLHFKELGMDIQKEPFTVAGIGDMSGDVFGNGMLLSKAIKLQAAFNHMHIFLDPDPNPEKTFKERERLFNLPRSSWEDYNQKLISKGGGIFERKAKSITLTPEIKAMLNVTSDTLTGEELITAILKMEVDLLWFGGIGTYIKNETETHFQVGDPANDAVRVDHTEVNARVIGEGANLGVTMSARIAMSMNNVKVNTDFIDNSAGVNMSDYEVNLKILLKRLMMQNIIPSMDARNKILEKATDEVTELVLKNNRGQHRLISMDEIRSTRKASIFHKLVQHYISQKLLNPAEETLPDHNQLEELAEKGAPIPRPALSTLQSYTKMYVHDALYASELPNKPELEDFYTNYIPNSVRKKFGNDIEQHYLKKEIITTIITNKIVNQAGITFIYQTEQITGKSVEEIVFAYLILDRSLEGDAFRKTILDAAVSMDAKYEALIQFDNMLQGLVVDLLQLPNTALSFELTTAIESIYKSLTKQAKTNILKEDMKVWVNKGFVDKEARKIAMIQQTGTLSDLIYFHTQESIDSETGLNITLQLDELFGFEWIKQKLAELSLKTQWELSQKDILAQSIRMQKTKLLKILVNKNGRKKLAKTKSEDILEEIETQFPGSISLYFKTLHQLRSSSSIDLAGLTVTINRLNFLNLA
jgi:glutamate dehydrogenase